MGITFDQLLAWYELPLEALIDEARRVHLRHFGGGALKLRAGISVKTGGCPEDCKFCPQSAHYKTYVNHDGLVPFETIQGLAQKAKDLGADHVCIGAAWRAIPKGRAFDYILEVIAYLRAMGLEVCCSLGMLNGAQARALKDAGIAEYNHNLDTSEEYYGQVITTRTYQERMESVRVIQDAGIALSCGGILGMGESIEDRLKLVQALAELQPKSIPLNTLMPIEGTPLGTRGPIAPLEYIRMIAVTRLALPESEVYMAGGRAMLDTATQSLCMYVGANGFYIGEKILATRNPEIAVDLALIREWSEGVRINSTEGVKVL